MEVPVFHGVCFAPVHTEFTLRAYAATFLRGSEKVTGTMGSGHRCVISIVLALAVSEATASPRIVRIREVSLPL